jgi:2-keto-4-pentenoate hydratase/2-oxohepta-3-ene-1,7-dioic acid hydratase in catechol pathway
MRFVTFEKGGLPVPGAGFGDGRWVDLAAACGRLVAGPLKHLAGATTLAEMIGSLHAAPGAALDIIGQALQHGGDLVVPETSLRLVAPIPRPAKNVFCVGRNYLDHVAEGDRARGQATAPPEHPQFFTKPPTAVIGPGEAIARHAGTTEKLDYEVELAVIIGKAGCNIPADRAYEHIFGYTILNDITGRDLQRRHGQWFKGKGLDRSCPLGPSIIHSGSIGDPQSLNLSLSVNGEIRQSANTRDMIFDIRTIISVLSDGITLEPGDIIATGTPSGVGFAMDPPRFLQVGDRVEAMIAGIGRLSNPIA